ncbi:MAG: hypothetical protein AB7P67_05920 [Vicinamibacterales bacterium]
MTETARNFEKCLVAGQEMIIEDFAKILWADMDYDEDRAKEVATTVIAYLLGYSDGTEDWDPDDTPEPYKVVAHHYMETSPIIREFVVRTHQMGMLLINHGQPGPNHCRQQHMFDMNERYGKRVGPPPTSLKTYAAFLSAVLKNRPAET